MRRNNTADIRVNNLNAIWNVLQHQHTLTRQLIAQNTGLSLMSITNLVDQLKRNGAIRILPPESDGRKQAGRKAEVIQIDTRYFLWLIINLTDLHLRYSLINFRREIFYSSEENIPTSSSGYLNHYYSFIKQVSLEIQPYMDRIAGVAVIVPGPYDADADLIKNARIPELNTIPIKGTIQPFLEKQEIYVDEDVKFAARSYAEVHMDVSSVYYLYIGEGVGGALMHNGMLYRGLNSMAGDLGILLSKKGKTFEEEVSLRSFAKKLIFEDMDDKREDQLLLILKQIYHDDSKRYFEACNEVAEIIAEMLEIVEAMLDPHVVVLDCCYTQWIQKQFESMIKSYKENRLLWRKQPLLSAIPLSIPAAYLGAVKILERKWLKNINNQEIYKEEMA